MVCSQAPRHGALATKQVDVTALCDPPSMKVRTGYRCADCGTAASGWLGRCPFCQAWGTVVEDARPARSASSSACEPLALDAVDVDAAHVISTGVGELDRVLGGGVLPGSVTLLGGEPGIGKSTLLLQVLAALGARGVRSLLVAGEESPAQVRRRAPPRRLRPPPGSTCRRCRGGCSPPARCDRAHRRWSTARGSSRS